MSSPKNVLTDLWLLSFLASRFVDDVLGDSSLSVDEFAMYGLIADLAPISASDLVRTTGLPPTTISSMIRRCEGRGELVRVDNPVDKRSSHLELTPKGVETLAGVVPRLIAGLERIAERLGGEEAAVRAALARLDLALRSEVGVGPRPYEIDLEQTHDPVVTYSGRPLDPSQAAEVRNYIDWIRTRDAQP